MYKINKALEKGFKRLNFSLSFAQSVERLAADPTNP